MGDSNSKYLAEEDKPLQCDVCKENIKHRHPNSKCFKTYVCIVNRRNLKYAHIVCIKNLDDCVKCGQKTMFKDVNLPTCLSCESIQ
jgi:hypothetical protein